MRSSITWVISAAFCLLPASRNFAATISQQPPGLTAVYPGEPVTLTVAASGDASLGYQWRKNGFALPGETGSSLSLPGVTVATAGRYDCLVTDLAGTLRSEPAWVSLKGRPQKWVLYEGTAIEVNASEVVAYDPVFNFHLDPDGSLGPSPAPPTNVSGSYLVFQPAQIPEGLGTAGAVCAFKHKWARYAAIRTDGSATIFGGGYGSSAITLAASDASNRIVDAGLMDGWVALLRANGSVMEWSPSTGTGVPGMVSYAPPGLSGVVSLAGGSNFCVALRENGTMAAWVKPGTSTTPLAGFPAAATQVRAIAAGTQHTLALRSDGTVVAWGDNTYQQCSVPAGLSSVIAIAAGMNFSLALRADGTLAGWGTGFTDRAQPATLGAFGWASFQAESGIATGIGGWSAPVISGLPVGKIVLAGDEMRLTPKASGYPVPSLMWRKDGSEIAGASTSSFSIPAASVSDSGSYELRAANRYGLVSQTVAVTVLPAPQITIEPSDVHLPGNVPGTLSITAAAVSGGSLSFQWFRNGLPVAGAASASHALGALSASNTGLWHCVVSEGALSRPSRTVRVAIVGDAVAWSDSTSGFSPWLLPVENSVAITDGDGSLVLKSDGSLARPQVNGLIFLGGQFNIPVGMGSAVQCATRSFRALALHHDGSVTGWQSNSGLSLWSWQWYVWPPQPPLPPTAPLPLPAHLIRAQAVSMSDGVGLALLPDGTVSAWELASGAPAFVPVGLGGVAAISSGAEHRLALLENGTVVAWGGNAAGQCNVPAGLTGVVAVSAGDFFSTALKADGTVIAWGQDDQQQVSGTATLTGVAAIRAGAAGGFATKTDGTHVAWGAVAVVPNLPAGMGEVVANPSLGKMGYSGIRCWGIRTYQSPKVLAQPFFGEVGTALSVPFLAYGNTTFEWYRNGVLIAGATGARFTPTSEGLYRMKVTDAYASAWSRLVRVAARKPVIAWRNGQAGAATSNSVTLSSGEPRLCIQPDGRLQDLNAFFPQPGPLPSGGEVFPCGLPPFDFGTLTIGNSLLPIAVLPGPYPSVLYDEDTLAVAVRAGRAAMVTAYGGVRAAQLVSSNPSVLWAFSIGPGYHVAAMLPTPTLTGVLDVAATQSSFLALLEGGGVAQWNAQSGVLEALPPEVSSASITAISGGADHFLALTATGAVVAWGDNSQGECDAPGTLAGVISIAAGTDFSLALKTDGTVAAWGTNANGETTVPAGLSGVTRISATLGAALAHRADGSTVTWGHASATPPASGVTGIISAAVFDPGAPEAERAYLGQADFTAPVIDLHPASISPALQDGFALRVRALSLPDASYQWHRDATPITGATSADYQVTSAALSDSGVYHCVVTNSAGSVPSNPATVTVRDVPVITQQPVGASVSAPGQSITLSVVAANTNGDPIAYQWLRDGIPVPGANASSIVLSSVSFADTGLYRVIVSSAAGSRSSRSALAGMTGRPASWRTGEMRAVQASPSYPPLMQALSKGEAWFGIGPNGGVASLVSRFSAIPTAAFPGAASYYENRASAVAARGRHAIVLSPAGAIAHWHWGFGNIGQTLPQAAGLGTYGVSPGHVVDVSVSDSEGLVLLTSGALVRWSLPAPGTSVGSALLAVPASAAGASAIASGADHHLALKPDGTVVAFGGSNARRQLDVPAGLAGVISVAAGDGFSLALRSDGAIAGWGSNASGALNIPSGLANVVRVGAGRGTAFAQHTDGTLSAWGQEGPAGSLSPPPALLGAVSAFGAADGAGVALVASTSAISFSQPPASRRVFPGYSGVVFSVEAVSSLPLSYQWQKDGADIPGATQPQLSITNASAIAHDGAYRVMVSSSQASIISPPVTLTVVSAGTFTSWVSSHFSPSQISAGLAAPGATPYLNGLPNLLAHALGIDPHTADGANLPRMVLEPHPISGVTTPGVSFQVPENLADVRFELETSSDFVTWTTVSTSVILGPVCNGRRCLLMQHSGASLSTASSGFYRVRAIQVPPGSSPDF